MWWTPSAPRAQARNFTYNKNNDLGRTGSWTAFACCATAAVGLLFTAASQSVTYGWAIGSAKSEIAGYIMAGGALAAAIMSPFCLMVAFSGRGAAVRIAALFLGLWCLAYGVSASLGFVSTSKDAAVSGRSVSLEARQQAKARFDAAAAEMGQLKGQAPRIGARRRELQAVMIEASKAMKAEHAVAAADPQATAIAGYLAALGCNVRSEDVSLWTTAFTTAFYEVAAALSLTVAAALRPVVPSMPVQPSTQRDSSVASQARQQARVETAAGKAVRRPDDDPPAPRTGRKVGRPRDVLPAEAVAKIRAAGGKVQGSINGIGKLIGSRSKTSAHRLLQELAGAGLITLATGPHGVAVALAA
jgi:hypothetical protein